MEKNKVKKLFIILLYKIWCIKLRLLSLLSFKTLGVRALVIKNDQVLLVKHTYEKGWYTVGGGVEKGETPLQGIKRELLEEAGITTLEDPELLGVYHTTSNKRDDYIIFYLVKVFSINEPAPSSEIAERSWFKLTTLPKDATEATQRRIQEYLNKKAISEKW